MEMVEPKKKTLVHVQGFFRLPLGCLSAFTIQSFKPLDPPIHASGLPFNLGEICVQVIKVALVLSKTISNRYPHCSINTIDSVAQA
jgi:hypothetical protein